MQNISDNYQVKLLNGLVVGGLSRKQLKEGIEKGKFLPSDFVRNSDGEWIHLKNSEFYKKKSDHSNGWMALFLLSFILNILMLILIFWQKARIETLLN